MIISFKFSVFELEIGHKILKELGEFTIFCMKAISNDVKVKDISDIIQIKKKIIKNQLSFAISRKYLTDDLFLTEKGVEIVELFDFIRIFNENEIKIALEHYIEDNSKSFFSVNNRKLVDACSGYLVKDNLFNYKIKNKFDELIEKDRSKIRDFMLNNFEIHKAVIEKHLDDFIFKIEKNEEQKFYNHEINENYFINKLNNTRSEANSYISIDVPILEIEKTITSEILDTGYVDKIRFLFDKYKYFNLINGETIEIKTKKLRNNSNLKIEPLLTKTDILKKILNSEKITLSNCLYIDMKTEIKEFYETRFFDISEIMENI